jgi:hypothetical protein
MIPSGGFFKDTDFDFEARIALGAVAAGVGDVGLVFATLDRVTDGDPQSWFDAWTATATGLAKQGDAAAAAGHRRGAAWAHLAAAEYFAKAMSAIDGLPDQSVLWPTFTEHRRCWDAVIDESDGRHLRFEIPYEGTTLPGYLSALVRDGLTNRGIGTRLFVSPRTVQTHVSHVLAKTGLRSRVEVAAVGVDLG